MPTVAWRPSVTGGEAHGPIAKTIVAVGWAGVVISYVGPGLGISLG